jgi:enterochelin esterase family protein
MRSGLAGLLVAFAVSAGVLQAQAPAAVAEAQALLAEQPHAAEQAWRRLVADGLPIVEPHPDRTGLARVTFAVKTRPDTGAVRLDSVIAASRARQPVTDYRRDFTLPLTQIGNSGIWWLSLDVPRDVEAAYSFLVEREGQWRRQSDPENRRRLHGAAAEAVLRLDRAPDMAPVRPWPGRLARQPEAIAIDSTALQRSVFLQLYRAPDGGADAPLLILYDAFLWGVRAPAWEIAANLAIAGEIPPVHVVLIDQLDPASAAENYTDQTRFLADELLTALHEHELDPAPRNIILAGASRRGLAVSRAALARPDAFGAVLSLSGSFYWSPEGEPPQWLAREVPPAEEHAPRFHLAAGSLEYVETSTNDGHVMLETNRRFAAALEAAGYEVELAVFPGGHDVAAWRYALADGLVALLGE